LDKRMFENDLRQWGKAELHESLGHLGYKSMGMTAKLMETMRLGVMLDGGTARPDVPIDVWVEQISQKMAMLDDNSRKILRVEYTMPGKQKDKAERIGVTIDSYWSSLKRAKKRLINLMN